MGYKEDLKAFAREAKSRGDESENIRELGIALAEAWNRNVQDTIDELADLVENLPEETLREGLKRHGWNLSQAGGSSADWIDDAFVIKSGKTKGEGRFITGSDGSYAVIDRTDDGSGMWNDKYVAEGNSVEEIIRKAKKLKR